MNSIVVTKKKIIGVLSNIVSIYCALKLVAEKKIRLSL